MSDPATISNFLLQTITGSTQSIKNAENHLRELQMAPGFIQNLLVISLETSVPHNIKKASIIYTLKMARDFIATKNLHKLNELTEVILAFMLQQNIEITLLKHLSITIETILLFDRDIGIKRKFQATYIEALQNSINVPDSNIKFQFLGLCAQICMSSTIQVSKEFIAFIKSSLTNFINLSIRAMTNVSSILETNNQQEITRGLKILKIFSYAIKLYLRKIISSDVETVKMLYEDNLSYLFMMSFKLALANNLLSSNIVYYQPSQNNHHIELLNSIKADFMSGLSFLCRAIFQNFKDSETILSHKLLQSENNILPILINTIKQLLAHCPYHQIKCRSTIKLIEQSYNLLIVCVRNNAFYNMFLNHKQNLLYGCILSPLQFSPCEYESFFTDPDEFINEILEVIEMDSREYLQNRKKQTSLDSEQYQQVESYTTLRTVTSTLLDSYCKYIDGTLNQIFQYVFNVFGPQQQKSQIPKSLLLCLIGILKKLGCQRPNLTNQVIIMLIRTLHNRQIPESNEQSFDSLPRQQQELSLQYAMLLITLYKYMPELKIVDDNILSKIIEIIQKILTNNNYCDCLKFISFDLITILANMEIDPSKKVINNFIKMMNMLLIDNYKYSQKILETMYYLYKFQAPEITEEPELVIGTVQHLAQIIYKEVEANKETITKLNINKSWNIISYICGSELFVPKFINEIENAVMPLLNFIDGKRQLDYEENIYLMMTSFIEKSQTVTQNQLVMFQIIPKLFYTQYNRIFGHAFETLQIFILYGSDILASAPQALHVIIDMCISSMTTTSLQISPKQVKKYNEAENSEGAMILHSLILSCGNSFTSQMWMKIGKTLSTRLENPPIQTNILKSNLIAGICIVIMVGSKNFSTEDNAVLLNTVLQSYQCCTLEYPAKVMIVSLSTLLSMPTLEFIQNQYVYILDTLLSLVILLETGQDLFSHEPITDAEREYQVVSQLVKNKITQLDEIQYIKDKLSEVRNNYPQIFQQSIKQLGQQKRQTLNELVSIKVIEGEKRAVFKIRKN